MSETAMLPSGTKTLRAYHLRILLITNVIPPYHKPLLDRLTQHYREVRVLLSTRMEKNRSWQLEWEGLDVVVQKTITLNRKWRHPEGFEEPLYVHLPIDTLPQIRRFQPDVVISWEMGVRTLFSALYRKLKPRSRLLVWAEIAESTEQGRGAVRGAIRKLLHHGVDGFLVTGDSGARYLKSLGVESNKIFKIAYTTDVSRFLSQPLGRLPSNERRILYVGQLIERKGLFPFFEVLAHWATENPNRQVAFTLAGDGPLRQRLEGMARPENLRVQFLGNVAYKDLPEVYAQAGIFVLPTLADTWGVVINEALAAGLPVLGSVYGQAVSELVREGENGWTFHADRKGEMLAALDRSLNVPMRELERMRISARETAARVTPDYVTGLVEQAIATVTAPMGARS
jgi:glycosyltransferase involved in cell wall biosynthesis